MNKINKYKLSEQEIDILSMLAVGCDYIEISNVMKLGTNGDYTPLMNAFIQIRNKIKTKTNTEAVYKCHDIISERLSRPTVV